MVFTSLPHRKYFLAACDTENGFHQLATRKIVFRRLITREMVFGVCHTESDFGVSPHGNDSYELATLKTVCSGLPHGEWFSRTYYTGTVFYGLVIQKLALRSLSD